MKIRLDITPGTKVETIIVDGEVVAVEIEPFFTSARGTSVMFYGSAVSAAGNVLRKFLLAISGATAMVLARSRDQSVVPAVDWTPDDARKQKDAVRKIRNAIGDEIIGNSTGTSSDEFGMGEESKSNKKGKPQ